MYANVPMLDDSDCSVFNEEFDSDIMACAGHHTVSLNCWTFFIVRNVCAKNLAISFVSGPPTSTFFVSAGALPVTLYEGC